MSLFYALEVEPGQREKSPENDLKKGSYLGIKGRTEASHERRGLQRIDSNGENSAANLKLVEEIDLETGEIITYQETKKGRKVYKTSQENRAERYALKSVVNLIFPKSETAKCSRAKVPGKPILILKDSERQKAFYAGLRRCGSVWWCPLCAAKIAERRRAELSAAMITAKSMGWHVSLMTCTVPHGLGDDVNLILEQMRSSWRRLSTGRAGKAVRKELGFEGTIRTLEVTHGANGFHPHFHILIFSSRNVSPSVFEYFFTPLWQDACVKSGLPCPSNERGLRVDDGSWAAKYASKWGLEDEMVKGHMKASKGVSGMTPWDMLRDVLKNRSERSRALFFVYAKAFKGQRQLYWSNGLKAKLAVEDVTDLELVAMQQENASELAELTANQWRLVLKTRSESAVLDLAERSPHDLPDFLTALWSHDLKNLQPGE